MIWYKTSPGYTNSNIHLLFLCFIDPGRVQVFVRIRPPNEDEIARGDHSAVSIEDPELTQVRQFDILDSLPA